MEFVSQNLIAISVAELPLNVDWERCFEVAAENGADGVELMTGLRADFYGNNIEKWVKRYHLPILSIHQPAVEILRLWVKRGNMEKASVWANSYVIHPPLTRGDDGNMYFDQMEKWGKELGVEVMLENVPPIKTMKWVNWLGKTDSKWVDIATVASECRDRDWKMTLDTSHWQMIKPDEEKLAEILPVMANIHISDWDKKRQHLGIGKGVMNVNMWMEWIKRHYPGQVTLELTPKYWVDEKEYLRELAASLRILRQWLK